LNKLHKDFSLNFFENKFDVLSNPYDFFSSEDLKQVNKINESPSNLGKTDALKDIKLMGKIGMLQSQMQGINVY